MKTNSEKMKSIESMALIFSRTFSCEGMMRLALATSRLLHVHFILNHATSAAPFIYQIRYLSVKTRT